MGQGLTKSWGGLVACRFLMGRLLSWTRLWLPEALRTYVVDLEAAKPVFNREPQDWTNEDSRCL